MIGQGFSAAPIRVLWSTRERLLMGLERVGEHVEAGTAHVIAEKRASSPVEAGSITFQLLIRLDEELAWRMNQDQKL